MSLSRAVGFRPIFKCIRRSREQTAPRANKHAILRAYTLKQHRNTCHQLPFMIQWSFERSLCTSHQTVYKSITFQLLKCSCLRSGRPNLECFFVPRIASQTEAIWGRALHISINRSRRYYCNSKPVDVCVPSQTGMPHTYPDSRLRQACPHRYFFSHGHVGVSVAGEHRLQLLKLVRGEVSPLPSLLSLLLEFISFLRGIRCGKRQIRSALAPQPRYSLARLSTSFTGIEGGFSSPQTKGGSMWKCNALARPIVKSKKTYCCFSQD